MVAAVRVHKVGGPEVLVYEEIDVPPPAQGQIRVKQHAIGVNFVDTYFRSGLYPAPGGLPFVAGNEAAGEVVAAEERSLGGEQCDAGFKGVEAGGAGAESCGELVSGHGGC